MGIGEWELGNGNPILIVRDMLSRMRFRGHFARIPALLALILLTIAPCDARPSRLVVIVAGNVSIRDIADARLSHLDMLLRNGSAALMNVRTGRPTKLIEPVEKPGMEPGCLTIGAGAMAAGGAEVRRAAGVRTLLLPPWMSATNMVGAKDSGHRVLPSSHGALSESFAPTALARGVSAGELYACRTGASPGRAGIVHTEIIKMQRVNSAAAYRAKPGLLGSALRAAGIETAVIGNSDIPGEAHREAAAIAMDASGLVDRGDIDSADLIQPDPGAPYGIRCDLDSLMREIDRALPWSRFVVVDFGDTYRADRYAEYCTDPRGRRLRSSAAARLDELVRRVSTRLNFGRDALILLSPSSRTFSEIEEERLSSIVIRGPDFEGGMLISPSTRRAGVVTICDVAPTVLGFFGLNSPADMIGRPARASTAPGSAPRGKVTEALLRLNLDASKQAQRQVAMRGASVCQSIIVVLATAALILGAALLKRAAAWAALVPVAIPLAMLYLPAFYSGGLSGAVAGLVALSALIVAAAALGLRSPTRAFVWLCAALVVSLAVDLARGAVLISSSIASYNLIEGARYYGLGNELMGTLLGATIMGVGAALAGGTIAARWRGVSAAGVFAVVFVFIGWPGLGADAGGAASAAPAMAVALLAARGWRPTVRSVGAVLIVAAIAIGGLFAVDALRGGGSQTHIGRIAGLVAGGGAAGVLQVAERKLALNFMLLSTSVWSRLLALSLIGSAVLYWHGRRRLGVAFLGREEAAAALGCCVGTAAAFAFNDSGVLAAAACSVYLWAYLALRLNCVQQGGRESITRPPARTARHR